MMTEFQIIRDRLVGIHSPEDLFGKLAGADRDEQRRAAAAVFRSLAKATHPDSVDPARKPEAAAAFQKLSELWALAEVRIRNGSYGIGRAGPAHDPITISSRRRQYRIAAPLAAGAFADHHQVVVTELGKPERAAVLKVARTAADSDLIANEARILRHLTAEGAEIDRHFSRYLPSLIETLRIDEGDPARSRQGNVLAIPAGLHSLQAIIDAHPDGLDPRDAAWMWNRLLEALAMTHRRRVVHGAITPANLLFDLRDHGLLLTDWCAGTLDAANTRERIRAVVPAYRDFYPPEVFAKEPPSPATDFYMATRCMLFALNGGHGEHIPDSLPWPLRDFIRAGLIRRAAHRTADALKARRSLEEVLARLYGPPKFRVLKMPEAADATSRSDPAQSHAI